MSGDTSPPPPPPPCSSMQESTADTASTSASTSQLPPPQDSSSESSSMDSVHRNKRPRSSSYTQQQQQQQQHKYDADGSLRPRSRSRSSSDLRPAQKQRVDDHSHKGNLDGIHDSGNSNHTEQSQANTSASSSSLSSTSPSRQRQRQPPLSSAAWSSLRQGQSSASTTTQRAPTDIFSRQTTSTPDPTASTDQQQQQQQQQQPASSSPSSSPSSSSAAQRLRRAEFLRRRRGSLPTTGGRFALGTNPLTAGLAAPVYPGSVLAALLSDILGFTQQQQQQRQAQQQQSQQSPQSQQQPQQPQQSSQATMPNTAPSAASTSTSAQSDQQPNSNNSSSNPTSQAQSQPLQRDTATSSGGAGAGTPPRPPRQPDTPFGGTSILIQGAMISRLFRREDDASRNSTQAQQAADGSQEQPTASSSQQEQEHTADAEMTDALDSTSGQAAPSTAQAASSGSEDIDMATSAPAREEQVDVPHDSNTAQSSTEAATEASADNVAQQPSASDANANVASTSSSSSSEQASMPNEDEAQTQSASDAGQNTNGSDAAADTSGDSASTSEAGTIDEQAFMLCRLTSIATAATAASLINGQSPVSLQTAAAAAAARPAQDQNTQAGTADQDTLERSDARSGLAERTGLFSQSSHDSSSNGVQSQQTSFGNRIRGAFARIADVARRYRSSHQSEAHATTVQHVNSTAQSDPQNDEEAATVDQALGPGVSIRPSGYVPNSNNDAGSSGNSGNSGGRTNAGADQDFSLSEMIHEAIRRGRLRDEAAGGATTSSPPRQATADTSEQDASQANSNNDNTASSDSPPQPLNVRLLDTLQQVRDGRLASDGHQTGTFERWLTDIGTELHSAVRTMADANGIVLSQDALNDGPQSRPTTQPAQPHPQSTFSSQAQSTARNSFWSPMVPDVTDGRLSFVRIFQFPVDAHRLDHTGPTLASRPAAGLIPCIIVAVNSNPVGNSAMPAAPQPQSQPQQAGQEQSDAGAAEATTSDGADAPPQDTAMSNAAPPSDADAAEGAAESSTADGTSSASATATATAPSADEDGDRYHTSRFNMFVSGGHFAPTHPILVAPREIAARDVMMFMRILAARSGVAGAGMGVKQPTSPVTYEELSKSGLAVKLWKEIKARSIGSDEGIRETVVETSQDDTRLEPDQDQNQKGGERKESVTGTTAAEPTPSTSDPKVKTQVKVPALRAGDHCNICLEEWTDSDSCRILTCRHVYHQSCVDEWLQKSSNSCPMCRTLAVIRGGDAGSGQTMAE
ncbi:unnamed protein product [Sympodiomycopsis kandeliae]